MAVLYDGAVILFDDELKLCVFCVLCTELEFLPIKSLASESYKQARYIESQVLSFLAYWQQEYKKGKNFDFEDCSFGNIIFSGAFLRLGSDFNQTISDLENEFKRVYRDK